MVCHKAVPSARRFRIFTCTTSWTCGSSGRSRRPARGYAGLTRFADDFVATFRYLSDARRFRQEMEERLAAFGLRVAPEKTALLYFNGDQLLEKGRPTRKPDTFVFLGFTHYLAKARSGVLTIVLKPSVKARERFISNVRTWLKLNRHLPLRDQRAHLDTMLNGFYQYFGLRLCCTPLYGVRQRVRGAW